MTIKDYKIGDKIRVIAVPPLVIEQMPEETIKLFQKCVGQELRIVGFNEEYELLEFHVEDDGAQSKEDTNHTIWLEPEYVEMVS
jgi:hypothetical protein